MRPVKTLIAVLMAVLISPLSTHGPGSPAFVE